MEVMQRVPREVGDITDVAREGTGRSRQGRIHADTL